ncbi:MAG TPA: hypothetical protein VE999_22230 [Gemmataceae bacterium]|nr:hypothetical protein [Gemmataceae bacterium]
MSKGHGRLQRELLSILEASAETVDTFTLTARALRPEPNADGVTIVAESPLSSVRRALGKLTDTKRIFDLARGWQDGRRRWASERVGLRYLIRTMQMENQMDAGAGRKSAILRRAEEMMPMIAGAHELAINIDAA